MKIFKLSLMLVKLIISPLFTIDFLLSEYLGRFVKEKRINRKKSNSNSLPRIRIALIKDRWFKRTLEILI